MNDKPRKDWLVIFSLWLMVFAASSQVMIVAPILPRIGEDLGIGEELQGTLITGYAVSLACFALIMGPISDRWGRRRILMLGTGAMAVALVLHSFATSYGALLGLRILAGASGGILTGSAVSYVGDYFEYERRGWANGWVMSGFAVGQVLGVPIGTVLADQLGFQAPFLMFAGAMAASFLLILTSLPQPDVERSTQPLNLKSVLGGYRDVLKVKTVSMGALAYLAMFFHVQTFVAFLPTWLEDVLHAEPRQVASLFLVGGIASVVFGPQAGRLSDRVGRKPLIIASCLGICILMASLTFWVTTISLAYLMFFLCMVLLALRLSPFQTLLSSAVPSTQRGTTLSLIVAVGQIGGGIGGAMAGVIYPRAGFLGNTLASAGGILITGLIVWLTIPEPERIGHPAPPQA